ncbi:hypothetical protein ARMSODRAFT_1090184 [Armillaria solidipes]|uniref:Uncharacterized protein n=1 Tax=Armillaria solidipes TaxID=1076256 RepID=A0A2H3B7M7_9AGAR|nr:hypothetical protein ARMSODRAFT_1090184 [Armillaria solidipes]
MNFQVDLFWSSRRSWIKFLFFVNRYLGLFLRFWDVIRERYKGYKLKHSTCGAVLSPEAKASKEIRCLLVYPESIIYVTIRFVVMGIILVLRVWQIMGRQCCILWTFLGWLVCTASASVVLYFVLNLESVEAIVLRFMLALLFEAAIFIAAAHRGIKQLRNWRALLSSSGSTFELNPKPIMQLIFQDLLLYFLTVLGALPIMSFLDTQLGLTIISITVTRMLLRLRRQALSDSDGQSSSQEELTTFRAVSGGMSSSEAEVADGS